MDQPLSKLLDSDLKTELAAANFLKQYKNYLLAAEYKGINVSASIPRILLCLSTIQKFHFEKLRLYHTLSRKDFHKLVSNQHLEDLEKIKYQVNVTLESMKDLLPNTVVFRASSVRMYFDDLNQILSNKKKFFMTMHTLPAKPWISPMLRNHIDRN